ncbi:MAG: hypothetical protein AAF940_12440 [Pseudomonadota bacterium]
MTGIAKMWLGLGLIYLLMLFWHQPLQGPLTEAEVRTAFGERYAMMPDSEDRQAARFLDFFANDDGRPFYMINLNDLPEETPDVEDAARNYGLFMLPRLLSRASYPVLTSDVIVGLNNTLDAQAADFQRLVVVRYRSRRDFLAIISSTEFGAAFTHKHASLDGWLSAPATAAPLLSVPQVAAIGFLAFGTLITMLRRRKEAAPSENASVALER